MFGSKGRQAARDRIVEERAAARVDAVARLGGNEPADEAAEVPRGDGMTFGTEEDVLRQRAAKAREEVRRAEGDQLEWEAARRG